MPARRAMTITFILGICSAVALFVQYLAMCDIAQAPGSKTDWYVAGVCMMLIAAFIVFSLGTMGYLLRHSAPGSSPAKERP
ncbi:MAG: hypothetical protein SF339_02265 [Blastocatellia bacterium]|nr:hypothetical protein [Blastocatellia bacterium]